MTDQLQRNPDDWKTGDEPMTDAQASYLRTLSEEAGEPFDEGMTKAQASERIDELQARSPRLNEGESNRSAASATERAQESGTPPHPSPAEGGATGGSPRPPRPSQAEGERRAPMPAEDDE